MPGPTIIEKMNATHPHDKYTSSNGSASGGISDDILDMAKIFSYVWTEIQKQKATEKTDKAEEAAAAKYTSDEFHGYTPPTQTKVATAPFHVAEYLSFTPPKEVEKPLDNKFAIRVTVCSTEEDCRKGAHEIVEIDADSQLATLKKLIRRHFQMISSKSGEQRVNLKGAHIDDEKVLKIKVMYAGANTWDVGCDSVPETTLTEENCSRTLKMLKKWGGRDTLCAIIAPPASN
jgi:hypothetical protein